MAWQNDILDSMFQPAKDIWGWLGGGTERDAAKKANADENKNAWEMYERQRSDALSDRSFENDYNSPANIMMRYKNAGLNPNLIYGNAYTGGASTRSASAQGAPKVRTEYGAPHVNDLMGMVGSVAGGLNSIATAKTVRANNVANTALAQANTVKSFADSARTTQQKQQSDALFGSVMQNAKLSNDKIAAETAAIPQQIDLKKRSLDQEDTKILQTARKLDQADIKLSIDQQKANIYNAKTSQDIKKSQEDILKSIVYRQTNTDVRQLLAAQISSAESKASIDSITRNYTARILDAQLSKNDAEVARIYTQMTNEILKSIPVLSYLIN